MAEVRSFKPVEVAFIVNGAPWSGSISPEETLLETLRERLSLTGTKRSCESEVCGACTVLVNGKAVSSCTFLTLEASGRDVLTIEGLEVDGILDPLQEAFMRHEGFQCGYCTPGMIMMGKALLLENARPTRGDVAAYLRGNICRCGAYTGIETAILEATSGS
jgi:aerobic-type carbon monoxide dehydrogenase small subunit (CoxS/CutS family)